MPIYNSKIHDALYNWKIGYPILVGKTRGIYYLQPVIAMRRSNLIYQTITATDDLKREIHLLPDEDISSVFNSYWSYINGLTDRITINDIDYESSKNYIKYMNYFQLSDDIIGDIEYCITTYICDKDATKLLIYLRETNQSDQDFINKLAYNFLNFIKSIYLAFTNKSFIS